MKLEPNTTRDSGALLSTAEVATRLSCCTRTVRVLIARGRLPAVAIGRILRVHPDTLAAFIAGGGTRHITVK